MLAKLADLAEEQHCAVVLVGHLNKAASRDAYIRVANSVAFWNAARSVVLVTEDPLEPESTRLIAQRKANLSRLRPVVIDSDGDEWRDFWLEAYDHQRRPAAAKRSPGVVPVWSESEAAA